MSYCRKDRKAKKKRKYPLKFYSVEYEYTEHGQVYVQAECESQARSIAKDDTCLDFDHVTIEEIDEVPKDEQYLDENGSYT